MRVNCTSMYVPVSVHTYVYAVLGRTRAEVSLATSMYVCLRVLQMFACITKQICARYLYVYVPIHRKQFVQDIEKHLC